MVYRAGPVKARRERGLTEENGGRYNREGFIAARRRFRAK
jgi:hypothetical protein